MPRSAAGHLVEGILRISVALMLMLWFVSAVAQERARVALRARREVSLTYEYSDANNLVTDYGTRQTGPITTNVLDFDVDYSLNQRWTLHAGLPLIARRYRGFSRHDPLQIVPPHTESKFLDDGHYHTYFQDLRIGASYLATTQPVTVEPFISASIPTNDYPFFANAAVGQNLKSLEIGTSFSYQPPFLRWYFSLTASHVFVEETLGQSVDHWRLLGEAGYFVNPRLAVTVFFSDKRGHGISPPATPDTTTELWYQHDRMMKHSYTNVGTGVNWSFNERDRLNVAVFRMAHAEDVFMMNFGLSVTVSRSF